MTCLLELSMKLTPVGGTFRKCVVFHWLVTALQCTFMLGRAWGWHGAWPPLPGTATPAQSRVRMLLCHWWAFASRPCSAAAAPCRRGAQAVPLWGWGQLPWSCTCPAWTVWMPGWAQHRCRGTLARLGWKTSPGCQPGTVGGGDLSWGCASPYFPFPN